MLQHTHLNMKNMVRKVRTIVFIVLLFLCFCLISFVLSFVFVIRRLFCTNSLYGIISPSLGLISASVGLTNEVDMSDKDDNITTV